MSASSSPLKGLTASHRTNSVKQSWKASEIRAYGVEEMTGKCLMIDYNTFMEDYIPAVKRNCPDVPDEYFHSIPYHERMV